ncbi:MAG: hypothetical protein JWO54_196 [Candidatus Saccharibacteria bacterium]|nr:hypothetical protein [Candidatus Saccharibacteria bacterium]
MKKTAAALVALAVMMVSAGCTSTDTRAEIECGTTTTAVGAQLKSAQADLKQAKTELDKAEGTARAAWVSQDVQKAKATVAELKECPAKDADPASDKKDAPSPCGDAKFEQVFIDRAATSKVEPRYDARVRPIIDNATLTPQQKVEAIMAVDLELAASNMQTLALWADGLGLGKGPNAWPELVEGGKIVEGACPTEAGKMLFAAFEGAYTAKGTTLEVGVAPVTATNTAINGDTAVADGVPGIYGDLTAVIITLKNGSKLIKLVRCGNVAFIGPTTLPRGPTDNPRCAYNPNLPPDSSLCVPPPGLTPKKPEQSTSRNPAVEPWIKDGGEKHTVNNNDGATDAQGVQADPQGDAIRAQQAAAAAAAAAQAAQQHAIEDAVDNGAGVVDPVQDHTVSDPVPEGW